MDTRSDLAMTRSVTCISHGAKGDREASSPERGNGPVPWSGRQTELLERTPVKKTTGQPSTQYALKLFAQCLALPNSPLDLQTRIEKFGLTSGIAAS